MEEVPHSEELELHIPFGFAAICVVYEIAQGIRNALSYICFFQNDINQHVNKKCELILAVWLKFFLQMVSGEAPAKFSFFCHGNIL